MARRIKAGKSAVAIAVAAGVAVSGAVIAPAAQAGGAPEVKVTRVIKKFSNCKSAGNWLNGAPYAGRANAIFTNRFTAVTVGPLGSSEWVARTHAQTTYQPKKSTIMLIVPTWPKMTGADRAALREYESALRVHEEGHQILARDILVHYSNYPLIGAGLSRDEALTDMRNEKNKYWTEIKRYMQARQEAYDARTENGRHQSKEPGDLAGKDVVLVCH